MTVSQFSTKLIRVFEGLRLEAYPDSGGVWTIGFGHTKGVTKGMTCTYEQAVAWFEGDLAPLLKLVEGKPLLEAAAYVSFGYNCGIGALKKLLAGEIQFEDRVKDRKGKVLPGLVSRRDLEKSFVEISRGENATA